VDRFNILLAGVGGQGILLAGDIISRAAIMDGFDVKKADTHGMAQRGGSVASHLRIGREVRSALIPLGDADLLIALEALEALRYAHYVKHDGSIVYSKRRIDPLSVLTGKEKYPTEEAIRDLTGHYGRVLEIDAPALAEEAGNAMCQNVAMIGAASVYLPIDPDTLAKAVASTVKRAKEANVNAFRLGRRASVGQGG